MLTSAVTKLLAAVLPSSVVAPTAYTPSLSFRSTASFI